MDDVAAVIVAAGKGQRLGSAINKVYIDLLGYPILYHTLEVFERNRAVNRIVVVVAPGEEDFCRSRIVRANSLDKVEKVIPGGLERADSVYAGLMEVDPACSVVVVHDGARPLFSSELLNRTIEAARFFGAALAAVPVKDTLKVADDRGMVSATPDRGKMWAAQTPQAFRRKLLVAAYEKARRERLAATDDAAVVEHAGYPVKLLMGEYENIKVTTPEDLLLARVILARRREAGDAGGNRV